MQRQLWAAVITSVLASCQNAQPAFDVPMSRSIPVGKSVALPAVVTFLEKNGIQVLEIDQAKGRVLAALDNGADEEWSACRPARVFSNDDNRRVDRGRPVSRSVQVQIDVADVETGSDVHATARFGERQINPFRNLSFQARCVSTGKLERDLFDALGRI